MNLIDPNQIDFAEYLKDISFSEVHMLKDASSFAEDVASLAEHGEQLLGAYLPFSRMNECIRIGDGKLSIWAGENGSGKSILLGQCISYLMKQGRIATIASLEMQPKQTLYRMICQSATCRAGRNYSLKWLDHFKDKLWIYDQLDSVATDRILGMAHYAAHELKAKDIVIDSLTKCGLSRDDYAKQAQFVNQLQWCAKRWDVHIHLVCHMRKPSAPGHKSNKNDIRGAAEITDLADNVFILRRNKVKEKHLEMRDLGKEYNVDILSQPCAILAIEKNRDYGHEGEFGLFFDKKSGCYKNSESQPLIPLDV